MIKDIFATAQIIISVLLVAGILFQQRGSALGSTFGQEGGAFYGTRRGIQKKVFWATVTMGALFIAVAILNIIF